MLEVSSVHTCIKKIAFEDDRCRVSTYFPATDSQQELHNVRLLLLLKLLDVLKGTHLGCVVRANVSNSLSLIELIKYELRGSNLKCVPVWGGLSCLEYGG